MNLNDHLTADEFPAMGLDQVHFDRAAKSMADQLGRSPGGFVDLEPDDGTRYELVVVRRPLGQGGSPYLFANSFGSLYPWMGKPTIHPTYALEHYVSTGNMHTATVLARFLNTLAEELR